MEPNHKNGKSFDETVFNSLEERDKKIVQQAFVDKLKAEVKKAQNEAEKISNEAFVTRYEVTKSLEEINKLKVEKYLAIGTAVATTVFAATKLLIAPKMLKKMQEHHDKSELRYSQDDEETEKNIKRSTISWLLK